MKNSTKIDSINICEALVRNRRLFIARRVSGVRRWVLTYAVIVSLFIVANGIFVAVSRLVAD